MPRASRRDLIFSAILALFAPRDRNQPLPNGDLLALGREFEALTSQLDAALASGRECDAMMEELHQMESQITALPARTIDDLRVKARAACWALLGDLEALGETTDRRMALSIVRDLIRGYDSHLERREAITKLIDDMECGAGPRHRTT